MDYSRLLNVLKENNMQDWALRLEPELQDYLNNINHGDYVRWQQAVSKLPDIVPSDHCFEKDVVIIGAGSDCSEEQRQQCEVQLRQLMPWRKGPFNLFDTYIDSEWRSNLKWARLSDKIQTLTDRLVLDIGCGNGYYGWRMLGEGARYVVGVDPTLLFFMQFSAIKKYLPNSAIDILPFGIQDLPETSLHFDTVFSMGVIYHRRDPIEHLQQLHCFLRPGGELVLETLVIETGSDSVLHPKGRYAKMNNVWAIPDTNTLLQWVEQSGFTDARLVDVTKTTNQEQRCTDWMQFESLDDFLDKEDNSKTVEGHPAPVRAILVACR